MSAASAASPVRLGPRMDAFDWRSVSLDLEARGYAVLERLLAPDESRGIAGLYESEELFRSRVVMDRHGFGSGEYKYFRYPLPRIVEALRSELYPRLAPIANRWNQALGKNERYPDAHADFLERCHEAGQTRPTPLLLQYGPNDYNCLHQDLYGDLWFPLQVAVLLSQPGQDFEGGEFVLTEQRPRMQTRPMVVPLCEGDGVVFAVNDRPMPGKRGACRVKMRHGVSRVRRGRRHTLGLIFHDAR